MCKKRGFYFTELTFDVFINQTTKPKKNEMTLFSSVNVKTKFAMFIKITLPRHGM